MRITDLFVRADPATGAARVQAKIHNAAGETRHGTLELTIGPATSGEVLALATLELKLAPGDALVETGLQVQRPRLWELNDPYLYRVTARLVTKEAPASMDERSVRSGFREFRFEDGYFKLNGKRVYLRSSHIGGDSPIGLQMPHDPDLARKTLLFVKVMGFNSIRFFISLARREQLDLCDELGILVYQETLAGWFLADSSKMTERFDQSIAGMIRRDRNHPSVVIWACSTKPMTDRFSGTRSRGSRWSVGSTIPGWSF